jgi:hypothetical protein
VGLYIAVSDVQNAMMPEDYLRLFDRDSDGDVETTDVERAIGKAERELNILLRASHATPFTGTIPDEIKDLAIDLVPWHGVKLYGAIVNTQNAPFRLLYEDAKRLLEKIAKDAGARLPTKAAEPIESATSYVSAPDSQFSAAVDAETDPIAGF